MPAQHLLPWQHKSRVNSLGSSHLVVLWVNGRLREYQFVEEE